MVLVGGLWVALGSHEGRNPLPTTWLEGGLYVAFMWLWVAFQRTTFPRAESRLCLRAFSFGLDAFPISILNTDPLSRLPRGGLGVLWCHPGTILCPQNIPRAPFAISRAYPNHYRAPPPQRSAFRLWMLGDEHWIGILHLSLSRPMACR